MKKAVTPEDKKPFISRQVKPFPERVSVREEKTDGAKAGCEFGGMPPTEILRPAGHGKIDLSVKWFMGQPDGLYFQSRYGTLRLCAITGGIVRVTFAALHIGEYCV